MSVTDFDTLGAFYLGKRYDIPSRTRSNDLVLYDAKDLTTHAVIIGMTGSGKTGLGVGLIEEALIDKVPVIAVDPKGDLGNLALRFPSFAASDFRPWVDPQQATNAGMTADQFAEQQASLWKNGLEGWQQDGARIQRYRDAADITIYTPGSTAGRPLSLLKAFDAPPAAVRDDAEALQERVSATATSLLALLGIDADPLSSREHILLSNLLHHAWQEGQRLDLAALIGGIQNPPFSTVGVMPLDTVFPPKDRMALAMQLNNLLASPGFTTWMQGEALDTASLLYEPSGKPRGSVISIAHLNDAERMFFMTLLLADIMAWVRTQPGTGSLRAILYIDELFGYMPPVANPPSKVLLLTLLKQARAYGLGVVLATQNPVDLDYRGLSNTGTWFIGRLQTERDKMRVMEGLEGVSGGQPFDKAAMEQTIAGLGKRDPEAEAGLGAGARDVRDPVDAVVSRRPHDARPDSQRDRAAHVAAGIVRVTWRQDGVGRNLDQSHGWQPRRARCQHRYARSGPAPRDCAILPAATAAAPWPVAVQSRRPGAGRRELCQCQAGGHRAASCLPARPGRRRTDLARVGQR
ncbi:MAG: ATP-binding protein [Gemmatimonas sp.]